MFLIDKLEEIESKDLSVLEKAKEFLKACSYNIEESVIKNPNGTVTKTNLVAVIKRIDNTWRMFARKNGYKEDFFRVNSYEVMKELGEDIIEMLGGNLCIDNKNE